MSSKPRPVLHQVETDEDLDELDDVLSEFTPKSAAALQTPLSPLTSPPPPPPTATTTTSFNRPRTNTRVDQVPRSIPSLGRALETTEENNEAALTDEFTKELVKNMEQLMRELTNPAAAAAGAGEVNGDGKGKDEGKEDDDDDDGLTKEEREKEAERLMKAAWEAMLIEGMDGATGDLADLGAAAAKPEGGSNGAAGKDDFQSKIKQTMNKLKQSESNLQAESSSGANATPVSLEGLLASLKDLGLDDLGGETGDAEDESELADFLENMMGQLMSKEVLYDPLKELNEKFPAYLANPPESVTASEKKRFETQYEYIKKILAVFDDPSYDEKNPEIGIKITELMSEMREYGSPPEEIMGPMPPGLGPDGNCIVT